MSRRAVTPQIGFRIQKPRWNAALDRIEVLEEENKQK